MKKLEVEYLEHQLPVFDCKAGNVVYVKGRRAGGTLGAVTRLIEIAHTRAGRWSRHLWVDTVHRNIECYVRRYFIPRLAGTAFRWNATTRTLQFEGGSYCDFGSAQRAETLEGFGYDYVWLNEAGTILRNEQIYYEVLLPMMIEREGGQFFAIGSPKGPGLFKKMFEWGQDAGNDSWVSFHHPSSVNPLLSRRAIERLRDHMPERAYRQEILAEFMAGDGAVFREVERIARATPESEARSGASYVLGVDLARRGNVLLMDNGDGTFDALTARLAVGKRTDRHRNFDPNRTT